jgi:hypothetical protein
MSLPTAAQVRPNTPDRYRFRTVDRDRGAQPSDSWGSYKPCGLDAVPGFVSGPCRGEPSVNFHGEKRRNDTHQSTTGPEALLARKGPGKEAKLRYAGTIMLTVHTGPRVGRCR